MNATPPSASQVNRRRGARRATRALPPVVPDWTQCDPSNLDHPALYINRELSWLEFNQRVLRQAQEAYHPLLERVKFLGIAATNLDEFFMVRMATLLKKYRAGIEDVSPDGMNTEEQLAVIRARALDMLSAITDCWSTEIRPRLAVEGIHLLEPGEYSPELSAHLAEHFKHDIQPVLTPLAFDPGHPFPYISNLSENLELVVNMLARIDSRCELYAGSLAASA